MMRLGFLWVSTNAVLGFDYGCGWTLVGSTTRDRLDQDSSRVQIRCVTVCTYYEAIVAPRRLYQVYCRTIQGDAFLCNQERR